MWSLGVLAPILLLASHAIAGEPTTASEFHKLQRPSEAIASHGPDLFGDQVDLYTGGVTFQVTDIDIPGNSALPVRLTRVLPVEVSDGAVVAPAGGSWRLDVPHLAGVFSADHGWVVNRPSPTARCSVPLGDATAARPPNVSVNTVPFAAAEYWHGYQMHVPGNGTQDLLVRTSQSRVPSDGLGYHWVTKDHWAVRCLPAVSGATGEGFLAVAPDGTRYHFNLMVTVGSQWPLTKPYEVRSPWEWEPRMSKVRLLRKKFALMATKVEDRYGNWVRYEYLADGRLSRIHAHDGRQITLVYSGGVGSAFTASDGSRSWQFNLGGAAPGVTQPDGARWSYSGVVTNFPDPTPLVGDPEMNFSACAEDLKNWLDPTPFSMTVTHPSGASGTFRFVPRIRGRSAVPYSCHVDSGSEYNLMSPTLWHPKEYGVLALAEKTLSGPGLSAQKWTYGYSAPNDSFVNAPIQNFPNQCDSSSCVRTVWTDVTAPDGSRTRQVFGNEFNRSEAQLQEVSVYEGTTLLERRTNTYLTDAEVAAQPFAGEPGLSPQPRNANFISQSRRPLKRANVLRQGRNFTRTNTAFDQYSFPTALTRASDLGHSAADTRSYLHDAGRWVLGQPLRETTNGIETARTDYDTQSRPWRLYRFGKLQHTLSYHADGTLASAADGRGNVTTFASWKRGIPQSIGHPDGTSLAGSVNDAGWVTAYSDENGSRTCYAYDAMGRLSKVTYPSESQAGVCDTSAWNPTTQAFVQVNGTEYGIPAGHWRQTVQTGNGVKINYFDALWRPLLAREYDAGAVSATQRFTRFEYDHAGRATFASYPGAGSSPATGIRTVYDALGRTKTVTQDSELGPLTTTTEYLSGFQTRVTNPRGFQTTTTLYLAFDEPTYDWPRGINHPEGAYTEIYRDVFGKPTALRRRNGDASQHVWRRYVYNGAQELCKAIEPESGSTVMGYDAAGNLSWSASGQALPNASNCDYQYVAAGDKVLRTYDARNRQTELRFPGGLGDTVTSYTSDGQPAAITAYNGSAVVTNLYEYNRRRLPTRERMQWGSIDWSVYHAYNANGHLSQKTIGAVPLYYAPNALGQPTQVGAYATGISYFPNGAPKTFTYGNGIVHTLTQNARGLPDRSRDVHGSTAFLDDSYEYDQNANVAAISDGATGQNQRGNRTMTYDGLDRLTASASPMMYGSGGATYAYDVLDNLTRVKIGGTATRDHHYCYDGRNLLTNVKTGGCGGSTVIGLDFDVQGNLKKKNADTFTFDFGNRLRSAIVGGVTSSYVYDGHGRRVRDVAGGSKYSMYTRDGQLAFVSNLREKKQQWHVYLGGSLVAICERDTTTGAVAYHYQHTDALGSPVVVTDANRVEIRRNEYEPYGKQLNGPPIDRPGYTGHVEDAATGLVQMQQRYYDPGIGVFLSVDPVTSYSDPVGQFHRYQYANNNPYKFTDPDGRQAFLPEAARHAQTSSVAPISPYTGPTISLPTRSGVVTSGFGDRIHPVTGEAKHHNGTDFKAGRGESIMSTQDGKVAIVISGGPGGNQIMVQNKDGSLSGYAHTGPAEGIKKGAEVSSGQVIGKSDGSGRITGPHLHYTYRPGTKDAPATSATKPVDPVKTQLKDKEIKHK